MRVTAVLLHVDVADSTKLGETIGDEAMSALWAEHDRMARDLLQTTRGREIDKSDGFLLMFDEAADALAYAFGYHRCIAALSTPMAARAGLHVGPVRLRNTPVADVVRGAKSLEIDGSAKALSARLMALTGSGQTLLSAEARAAMTGSQARLKSHGHWRFKGFGSPVELFEVREEGREFQTPPDAMKAVRVVRQGEFWLPCADIPYSVPAERDAFVGRSPVRRLTEQDIADRVGSSREMVNRVLKNLMSGGYVAVREGLYVTQEAPRGALTRRRAAVRANAHRTNP